jgi:hypothetical protein
LPNHSKERDFEAEERALDVAAAHPNIHAALAFLVEWMISS